MTMAWEGDRREKPPPPQTRGLRLGNWKVSLRSCVGMWSQSPPLESDSVSLGMGPGICIFTLLELIWKEVVFEPTF